MKNKIKRTLLCLLAVSMMTVSANIYADSEEEAETAAETAEGEGSEEGAAEEKAAKLKESEEKVRAEYDDITAYLRKVGSADGIDVYAKDKGFEDAVWAKNGGEPEKKSDYTEAQEAIADMIGDLKKLGDLVAVDPAKKRLSRASATAVNATRASSTSAVQSATCCMWTATSPA